MIALILGKSGSGKSVWAERLAVRLRRGRLVYIATMIPYGEDGRQRVERHREQRRDSGFTTLELPQDLRNAQLLPDDTVLLEDVSNLAANMLFGNTGQVALEVVAEAVLAEIIRLAGCCANLLLVGISGLMPNSAYDAETNEYIEVLRRINRCLWDLADTVYELEQGQPLLRKGSN